MLFKKYQASQQLTKKEAKIQLNKYSSSAIGLGLIFNSLSLLIQHYDFIDGLCLGLGVALMLVGIHYQAIVRDENKFSKYYHHYFE